MIGRMALDFYCPYCNNPINWGLEGCPSCGKILKKGLPFAAEMFLIILFSVSYIFLLLVLILLKVSLIFIFLLTLPLFIFLFRVNGSGFYSEGVHLIARLGGKEIKIIVPLAHYKILEKYNFYQKEAQKILEIE